MVFFTLWLLSCKAVPTTEFKKCKNVVIGKMKINDYDQLLTVAAVYNAYLCRVNTYIPRCKNGIMSRTWIERWKINDYGELPTATNSSPPRTRGKTTALIKGVLTYLRFHALGILTKPYRTKTNHTIPYHAIPYHAMPRHTIQIGGGTMRTQPVWGDSMPLKWMEVKVQLSSPIASWEFTKVEAFQIWSQWKMEKHYSNEKL